MRTGLRRQESKVMGQRLLCSWSKETILRGLAFQEDEKVSHPITLCRGQGGEGGGCSRALPQDSQHHALSLACLPTQLWVWPRPHGSPGLEQGEGESAGELEVRIGGQRGGGGLHLTGPPLPPPPWHHKARSRISPVPALTSRQRRRILSHAIWRARRSPEHCGGRGRGQRGRCPPQSQEEAAGPPPPKPFWT